MPTYRELLLPTLQSLAEELGGSASNHEVIDAVIDRYEISEAQLAVLYPEDATAKGPKVNHRIAFALSSLKGSSAVENPSRGLWVINGAGRRLLAEGEEAIVAADRDYRERLRVARERRTSGTDTSPSNEAEQNSEDPEQSVELEDSWKHELMATIVELMDPVEFEELVLRLMRLEGVTNIRSTPASNDGGIDGTGVVRSGLLTFPVCFQMKRYKAGNNVGAKEIRDLRGAVAGRGGRGIFVTSSDFTSEAESEARRNQDSPLELINGIQLAELLCKHSLGVSERPVVDRAFFDASSNA